MSRHKLTDLEKKKIIADYLENQNYSLTAKINNTTVDTVRRLMRNNESVKNLREKKEENTQSVIEYMQTQHETKKRILDKILKAIEIKVEDIDELNSIKELATAYGIILDKELKVLELQRGSGSIEGLEKVKELLGKIESEAQNDTK